MFCSRDNIVIYKALAKQIMVVILTIIVDLNKMQENSVGFG